MNILVYMWLYLTALQDDHIPTSVLSVNGSEQTEGEHLAALGSFEPFPFRHGYAATLSPHAGTAFG